jgi:predicted RNase H-like HicB family nuclease
MVKIIRISIRQGESGLLFAESPDLKGLLVAGHSRAELDEEIPECIKAMLAALDMDVEVLPVESKDADRPWAAVPVPLASNCLEGRTR